MKRLSVVSLFIVLIFSMYGQVRLSPDVRISVLTVSQGDQLYNMFGHSAIRVYDSVNGIDWIFNYGTFDFNAPNFYLNFIKGYLNYMLSIETYRSFEYMYKSERRWAYEQVLDLSYEQKMRIISFLLWNARPENRYYLYDVYYDNCATRVRDVIFRFLADSLIFENRKLGITFRDAYSSYILDRPWLLFGINFLNGMVADKELDLWYAMFLPEYVDSVIAQLRIKQPDGSVKPLVKEAHYLFYFDRPKPKPVWYNPFNVFSFLLVILVVVTYLELKRGKWWLKWFDLILIGFIGLAGILLVFLWIWSMHLAVKDNLNVLWAVPFHLVYVILLARNRRSKLVRYYSVFFAFYYLIFVGLILFNLLPQDFDRGVIPLSLIFALRFYRLWKLN